MKLTNRKKIKYIAVFLVKDQNSYSIERQKRFSPIKNSVNHSGKEYIIDIGNYTFISGLTKYYLIDYNSALLGLKDDKESKVNVKAKSLEQQETNPEIIDAILSKSIIRQIVTTLSDSTFKINLAMISIGLIIGGLTGYIIGVSI